MNDVSAQVVSCCVNDKSHKNYAAHAWLYYIPVWLLGQSVCSSPSTKELHGMALWCGPTLASFANFASCCGQRRASRKKFHKKLVEFNFRVSKMQKCQIGSNRVLATPKSEHLRTINFGTELYKRQKVATHNGTGDRKDASDSRNGQSPSEGIFLVRQGQQGLMERANNQEVNCRAESSNARLKSIIFVYYFPSAVVGRKFFSYLEQIPKLWQSTEEI